MLKGHTKIELTNEETKEKTIVEHDNMITDALEDLLFSSLGRFPMCAKYNIYKQSYNPSFNMDMIEGMFGGLILWKDALDISDPKDYWLPLNNSMTGYSYLNCSNNGNNKQLGSFSKTESGWQEDGSYKFVYNFNVEQGNGQISAVSLCPYYCGMIGAGLSSPNYFDSDHAAINFLSSIITGDYDCVYASNKFTNNYAGIFVGLDENYTYFIPAYNLISLTDFTDKYIKNNGKKLILSRYSSIVTNIGIQDKAFNTLRHIDDIEVQLPDNFDVSKLENSFYGCVQGYNNSIYLCFNNTQSQSSIQICKIDIDTLSTNVYSLTCPASNTFFLTYYYVTENYYQINYNNNVFRDNIFYSVTTQNNICYINLLTNESGMVSNLNWHEQFSIHNYDSKSILAGYRLEYDYKTAIIDFNNEGKLLCLKDILYNNITFTKYGNINDVVKNNSNILNYLAPFQFLSTKNNLDAPVVKTSTQSMVVTYTLTPA